MSSFYLLLIISQILFTVNCEYYDCNEALFDKANVTASSYQLGRDAREARLDGQRSWTASHSDNNQYFVFDLDRTMRVSHIATQGRGIANDYVYEYAISYGSNGYDYSDYKSDDGNVKVFKGNTDSTSIVKVSFDVPIIARFVRINPLRWKNSISMRVELYGCGYYALHWSFNGNALVKWNLRDNHIVSTRDIIFFRLKTNSPNGIILYSRGTQRDYFVLQVKENRLVLNINLGSGQITSFSVGTLLDDNIWHDVSILRNYNELAFSVDRVTVKGTIQDDYSTLNLDNAFYIGGVPNKQAGMMVTQNFTGCIENFYLNETNINQVVKDAYDSHNEWIMQRYEKPHVAEICPERSDSPVTFTSLESHAKLMGYEGVNYVELSLSFRTYREAGLIVMHYFTKGFFKMYLEYGKLFIDLETDDHPLVTLNNVDAKVNDGRWHDIELSITKNKLVWTIDRKPYTTTRLISFRTSQHPFYIAGNDKEIPGFIGCMKLIRIHGNRKAPTDWKVNEEYGPPNQVLFDACKMRDQCTPNPCHHNGICTQEFDQFKCECADTGYGGLMCNTPLYLLSCEAYKQINTMVGQTVDIDIDIDGSGPLKPFPVTCEFAADDTVVTVVHHRHEEEITVDGYQEEGSYVHDIGYHADADQLEALINRSHNCWQNIRYNCLNARLFNSHTGDPDFNPYSWWVSRYNQKMDFWGGAMPGSRRCHCGVMGECNDPSRWCNCDGSADKWATDEGDILGKEYLPVKQIRIGDTGTFNDSKKGKYILGPLKCEGNDLFSKMITFRKADAAMKLPQFDFGKDSDVYFEFKTTVDNGIIMNSKGYQGPDDRIGDEIRVELQGGNAIFLFYRVGDREVGVRGETGVSLANDNWHSVYIERNRKGVRIIIDGNEKGSREELDELTLSLFLTSGLFIGGSVSGGPSSNGYIGCLRALMLDGQLIDLEYYAKKYIYGVSIGCVGKCLSNPCLNNGVCIDHYSSYSCDCRFTSFKGPICADEIGVTLRDNSMIRYQFNSSFRSTISEKIRVGFTTSHPQGFLLGLFSELSKEYMTIAISNSGHLRVVFDFGFERQELIYPDMNFGLGQDHDLTIRREDKGRVLVMKMDNYEPVKYRFNIKDSADAQFNNINVMYIGKNESMKEGFVGCVSRVEFDDIYPLKMLFQQGGADNIRTDGNIVEDFCGIEPYRHAPEPLETRPPLDYDPDKVNDDHTTERAITGLILFLVFLAILLVVVLFGRYYSRRKGDYLTQEEQGCYMAEDPDTAVINAKTGHSVRRRKEFFM